MSGLAMGDRHDYVALEWVKGEIAETLKQARQSLEDYVEQPRGSNGLSFCLAYIHQVHGILQMVEFFGAALLAEEMELLAQSLLDEKVTNVNEALEVLMQAILQLPRYLESIQSARRDLPMAVLPLLNDLRAARGEKFLSQSSLFSPRMPEPLPELSTERLQQRSGPQLDGLLRKIRQTMQMALIGLLRDQQAGQSLTQLARGFAGLEKLSQGAPVLPLWQAASGLIDGLANRSLELSTSVRSLLRQLDGQLREMIRQGGAGLNKPAPEELLKNILFYVAKAQPNSPRLQRLHQTYNLTEALPVEMPGDNLADRDAIRSVVSALCEELVRVKDSLDLFVRSDRTMLSELDSLQPALKQIADTLAVLGFAQQRKVVLDQADTLQAIAGGQQPATDAGLMDVAGALLYLEATLVGMVGSSEALDATNGMVAATDLAQVHRMVIREARTGLEEAKDGIIEFIASQWKHEHLEPVSALLNQVRGGLMMISLPRAAQLVDSTMRYIDEQLLATGSVPSWQDLDTLADAITSVDYYLERLYEDQTGDNELVLDTAAMSMEALGYPLAEMDDLELAGLAPGEARTADSALDAAASASMVAVDNNGEASLENELEAALAPLLFASLDSVDETGEEDAESVSVAASGLEQNPEAAGEGLLFESFELPEIELPETAVAVTRENRKENLQDILAAPVSPLNPPATEVLESLLPPPEDEEPVDEELQEVFVEEAGEVLDTLTDFFPQWQQDTENNKALAEVRRAFHTLKGSGRMVRALVVGELAWAIENMLNRVIEGSVEPSSELLQVIADVIALLPELVAEYAGHRQRQRDDVDRLAAVAHALARKQPLPVFSAEPVVAVPEQAVILASDTDTGDAEEDDSGLDPVLVEIFESEARGHLRVLQVFVQDCREFLPRSVSEDLQRAMHTLKGSAHMAGITPVAELATASERLVKEYRAHLFSIEEQEADLLERSADLLEQGLDQLADSPLQPLSGSAGLIQELEVLLEQRLACAHQPSNNAAGPLLISSFLAEGMDLLLDMEDHLQSWRTHPADSGQLVELIEELAALKEGARMAELEPIEALGDALSAFYRHVHAGGQQLSDEQFEQVASAHEALISMMDEVAAGLDVTPQPQQVDSLHQLLAAATGTVTGGEPVVIADSAIPDSSGEADFVPAPLPGVAFADTGFDPEMAEIFLDEALDLMDSANQSLDQWLDQPEDTTCLTALMRDLHTLKGGARMAGIKPVGDLAHELETVYEGLLDGRYTSNKTLDVVLHGAHDQLAMLLEQLQAGQPLELPQAAIENLQVFRKGVTAPGIQTVEDVEMETLPQEEQPAELPPVARIEPEEHATAPVLEVEDIADVPPVPETITEVSGPAVAELDNELVEIFLEEAFEILEQMSSGMQDWLAERDNQVHVEGLQRDLHTLKGGARMAELPGVADLAHELEYLYEDLVSGRMQYAEGLDSFLYEAHDLLSDMLEAVRDGRPLLPATAMVERVSRWRKGLPDDAPVTVETPQAVEEAPVVAQPARQDSFPDTEEQLPVPVAAPVPADEAGALVRQALPFLQKSAAAQQRNQQQGPQEQVRIPAELLEGLVNLAGETSIFRGRVEQQVSDFGYTLGEMETTLDRIRDQLRRLDTETQAQILSRLQTEGEGSDYADFDPLEMDRHSQLQQLSRSLFESASDLLDLKETLAAKSRDAETLLLQQARVNTELQEGLMRTRMVPFERLVPRLRRIVRQVSGELGKQADLVVANAEGEMDRSVMERMVAPLEHMLRNAVGHGLELPEVRRELGKPEKGAIRLELGREGADILLVMSDDGAGIDVSAVRRKAVERGLMSAQSELSDQEVMQFILHAGFSTAAQVTQVSGRGVGMDVVSSEIKQLGGAISIESEPGKGTKFLIRLPFTVSVNRALMVMTGEDLYAIPLNTVEGIVRVSPYELEALYEQTQRGEPAHYEYAGQRYDLKYLGDLLANGQQPKLVGQTLPLPVLLVRSSEHAMAVQVDSLAGSREIVVKGLGPQFANVPSLSGATILGDGRVVVILDLLAAIRSRYALQALPGSQQPRLLSGKGSSDADRALHVMVVDDSVTVRKVTSRLLERYGMNVSTASDGVDAINQLQERRPDIMLLDIEMPRMDGFEVATLVRHDEKLRDLPIIMITSRTGDKHRERAMAIGVDEYLGKPYQEAQLLEKIRQLTDRDEG